MNQNEKAAALLEQDNGRQGSLADCCTAGLTPHQQHFTFSDAGRQAFFVAAVLPHGKGSAVPARNLCALLGISDDRDLRRAVERERASGALILSAKAGYFLPSLDEAEARREVAAFVRRSDARLKSNRASVRAAKRALRRLSQAEIDGQCRIGEV